MKQLIPFFGEVVGRNDIDFLNEGNREALNNTHITLTNSTGGVVNGMSVSISGDKLSLLVGKGTFYTSGSYSPSNNSGGGELGNLLQQQFFTNLPSTPPVGTNPQYLLVYAKIVNTNTDPDPLKSSVTVTSKNLQTGENVPVRQYPKAIISITNAGFKSSLLTVQGVHLALIQVDYIGISQISSSSSIQYIDESVRNNYIVGGTIDVNKKVLIDAGVPDNFLTTRMYQDNSISGPKFLDNSIGTQKISIWDGVTLGNNLTGSGVATQNIKDEAVTSDKINFISGLNNFGNRNLLSNSSFEIFSGTSTTDPESWDLTKDLGTNIYITTFANDNNSPKFGNNSLFMLGGIDGSNNSLNLTTSQIADFSGQLKNIPISAFFWAKQISTTNFSFSGTTGLKGKLEFLDDNQTSPTVLQSQEFGVISGVTATGYLQYTTLTPIIYTGTTSCQRIRYTIGGNFNGSYYVDGAWVGASDIIPGYDKKPSEYMSGIIPGSIGTVELASGAVNSSKLAAGAVTSSAILNANVTGAKIASKTITAANIQDGTITVTQLDPTILQAPTIYSSPIGADYPLVVGSTVKVIDTTMTVPAGKSVANISGKSVIHWNAPNGGNGATGDVSIQLIVNGVSISQTKTAWSFSGNPTGIAFSYILDMEIPVWLNAYAAINAGVVPISLNMTFTMIPSQGRTLDATAKLSQITAMFL